MGRWRLFFDDQQGVCFPPSLAQSGRGSALGLRDLGQDILVIVAHFPMMNRR